MLIFNEEMATMSHVDRVLQCKEVKDWKIPAFFDNRDHDIYMYTTERSQERAVKRGDVTTADISVVVGKLREDSSIP